MAVTCPIDFDVVTLRAEVQALYSRVAAAPDAAFHFHRGPQYAASMLGYDATELAALPSNVTSSFAGVGNPHLIQTIPTGATVVDIGCGAGTDLLLAARRTGRLGLAIGVDMTEAMRQRASEGARACGLDLVEIRAGDAARVQPRGEFNFLPLGSAVFLAGRLEHARQRLQGGRAEERRAPALPQLPLSDVGVAVAA